MQVGADKMQVHLQLILVCALRQLQLFLVEKRVKCRSARFQMQVLTRSDRFLRFWVNATEPGPVRSGVRCMWVKIGNPGQLNAGANYLIPRNRKATG